MLIEFRVTNYRSIAKTQVLSMVASSDHSLEATHCIKTGINVAPKVLRSAVVYGPNASGKSTLISALASMRRIVETSATSVREGEEHSLSPFRFDKVLKEAPTEFEVTFIEKGIRYQYGFALTKARIHHEWLFAYVEKKPQRWFERTYNASFDSYDWDYSTHFPAHGGQRLIWEKSTRSNALFLSTAINLNSEQLRPIFHWFVNKLVVIASGPLLPDFTVKYVSKGVAEKNQILRLLQTADFRITDINIENRKQPGFAIQLNSNNISVQTVSEVPTVRLSHQEKDSNQFAEFDIAEESTGTQRWFSFAGPIIDVLQNGRVLIIDELDSSLHTLLARLFISMFHNPEKSQQNAQLIFSTHNTALLDKELFRRDQIWFIEKNSNEASQLYPLTDFSPRKEEALEKGYLLGRYGALPFFGEISF